MRNCKNCGKPTKSKKGYCQRTLMCNFLNRLHGRKNNKKQDKECSKTIILKKQGEGCVLKKGQLHMSILQKKADNKERL